MYKIIGTDGREYGPVSAGQIRQWILENRVERQTPVFVDGAKDWSFAGLLPEFAGDFSGKGTPSLITPLKPGAAQAGQLLKTNPFAIAGFVCGILSLTFCWCCGGFPFNILGLTFSLIALSQINENPQFHTGRSLAWSGIVLSAASFLIFLALIVSGHTHVVFNNGQFR